MLDDLSIEINPGEIIALLGASGCGKSTMLRAIAGLQPIQSGKIEFTEHSRRSGDLAFVFQDATLLPWRTVLENVSLPFELGSAGRSAEASSATNPGATVRDALRSVGLTESEFGKFPRQLSGGMRMRTSIARALVTDPSVMLLDEPFAALDDILRTRLNTLLLELWSQRRRTIVFVTHNIAEAIYLSHRIAIFGLGKLAAILDNPLPWPRTSEQRASTDFGNFYSHVSQQLNATTQMIDQQNDAPSGGRL